MDSVDNFLGILHEAHRENARSAYFAKRPFARPPRNQNRSTMPMTSFVYEFFIYNSIYQYDWEKSCATGKLTPWLRESSGESGLREDEQQDNLEAFIKERCKETPAILLRAFEPLSELTELGDDWTKVVADARITQQDGQDFFRRLSEFADRIRKSQEQEGAELARGRIFKLIYNCRFFVYKVRNNIFHGSKSLDETSEPNQRRRIEVYDLFLKCLVSLFFLAMKKEPVASDEFQFPIHLRIGDQERIDVDQGGVIELLGPRRGLGLKPEDTRLIQRLKRLGIEERGSEITERSTLFYPSAGTDVILPTLLGLPFCSQFYFYNNGSDFGESRRTDTARAIRSKLKKLVGDRIIGDPTFREDEFVFQFAFGGHDRAIHCVCRDNLDFLNQDVDLTFFFHRGDSPGECGCGQYWDSELLGQLVRKVPPNAECQVLTDGEPGGVHSGLLPDLKQLHFSVTERGRDYYYGRFSGDALGSRLA